MCIRYYYLFLLKSTEVFVISLRDPLEEKFRKRYYKYVSHNKLLTIGDNRSSECCVTVCSRIG